MYMISQPGKSLNIDRTLSFSLLPAAIGAAVERAMETGGTASVWHATTSLTATSRIYEVVSHSEGRLSIVNLF